MLAGATKARVGVVALLPRYSAVSFSHRRCVGWSIIGDHGLVSETSVSHGASLAPCQAHLGPEPVQVVHGAQQLPSCHLIDHLPNHTCTPACLLGSLDEARHYSGAAHTTIATPRWHIPLLLLHHNGRGTRFRNARGTCVLIPEPGGVGT
eukprot:8548835-Pyramimonas_sp.AAC.5